MAFNKPATVPFWSPNVTEEIRRFSSWLEILLASSAANGIRLRPGVLGWLTIINLLRKSPRFLTEFDLDVLRRTFTIGMYDETANSDKHSLGTPSA